MELPARVGDFELIEVLGEGGTGAVYGGTKDGVAVAVKVLRDDLELTEREAKRFFDEAAKMRRVAHPAIVPVLEAGTLPDGRPFLSMPRLEGETLAARIERGALPRDEALRIFAELADAVATLHAAGLVHRDIKPENVLLARPNDRAVLLDLGIAREVDGARSTTTTEGRTRGTPAYMAPERFFGAPATIQSDVYELAVVLYAMLTGRLPWREEDGAAGRLTPVPPDEAGATLPPALSTALLRALSTRVEARPSSVAAFRDAVERGATTTETALSRTTARVDVPVVEATAQPHPPPSSTRTRLAVASALLLAAVGLAATSLRSPTTPASVPTSTSAAALQPLARPSASGSTSPSPSPSAAESARPPAPSTAVPPVPRHRPPPKSARPAASSSTDVFYEDRR